MARKKQTKDAGAPSAPTSALMEEAKKEYPAGTKVLVHGHMIDLGGVKAWMEPLEGEVASHSIHGHITLRSVSGALRSVRREDIVKQGERQRKNPPAGFMEDHMASNAKARKEKVAKVRTKRTWADGTPIPASATSEFLDRAVAELEKGTVLFPAKSKRGGRILVRFAAKWLARLAAAKKVEPTKEWIEAHAVKEFKATADHAGMSYTAKGLAETPAYMDAIVKQTRKFAGAKAERRAEVKKDAKARAAAKKGKKVPAVAKPNPKQAKARVARGKKKDAKVTVTKATVDAPAAEPTTDPADLPLRYNCCEQLVTPGEDSCPTCTPKDQGS